MKTAKQSEREARQLYRLCLVQGQLDEDRARTVVHDVIDAGRTGRLAVLSRFQRLVKLDRLRHTATVESAAPLADDLRAAIESGLTRRHGETTAVAFAENPSLIGGIRIQVGSHVYDGSVKGRLSALAARW
jgi:F-type H+-transporting ATPase subunit delta